MRVTFYDIGEAVFEAESVVAAFMVEVGDFGNAGAVDEGGVEGSFLHCEDIDGWDVGGMLCLGSLQRRVRRLDDAF